MLIVVGRIYRLFFWGGGAENRKMKQSFNTFPRYLRKGTRFCMNELNLKKKNKKQLFG